MFVKDQEVLKGDCPQNPNSVIYLSLEGDYIKMSTLLKTIFPSLYNKKLISLKQILKKIYLLGCLSVF